MEPKGIQREPNGYQRDPKGTPRELTRSHKELLTEPKGANRDEHFINQLPINRKAASMLFEGVLESRMYVSYRKPVGLLAGGSRVGPLAILLERARVCGLYPSFY